MNGGKAFFDTNVLLYMYSSADVRKQARARDLYREYALANRILLSTQVVQEFFVAGLRKLTLPRQQVREVTAAFLDSPLVIVGPSHIRTAIEKEDRYNISFWDALIVAAAESGGAEVLYTEDLNDGQRYGAVLVRNPFRFPVEPVSTN
jgi:predicted nucleic acid-binding protein